MGRHVSLDVWVSCVRRQNSGEGFLDTRVLVSEQGLGWAVQWRVVGGETKGGSGGFVDECTRPQWTDSTRDLAKSNSNITIYFPITSCQEKKLPIGYGLWQLQNPSFGMLKAIACMPLPEQFHSTLPLPNPIFSLIIAPTHTSVVFLASPISSFDFASALEPIVLNPVRSLLLFFFFLVNYLLQSPARTQHQQFLLFQVAIPQVCCHRNRSSVASPLLKIHHDYLAHQTGGLLHLLENGIMAGIVQFLRPRVQRFKGIGAQRIGHDIELSLSDSGTKCTILIKLRCLHPSCRNASALSVRLKMDRIPVK